MHETPHFFRRFFSFDNSNRKKNNTQLYTHFGCEDNIDDGARRICDKIIGGKELSTESFLLLSFRQCMRKNFEKPNQREMNE